MALPQAALPDDDQVVVPSHEGTARQLFDLSAGYGRRVELPVERLQRGPVAEAGLVQTTLQAPFPPPISRRSQQATGKQQRRPVLALGLRQYRVQRLSAHGHFQDRQ